MIIEPAGSSLSPRPRRASAPIPKTSVLLHKQFMAGEQPEETDGPTLDQCLVLPPGIALKIDGLLSPPLSKSGAGRESDGGVGENGGSVGHDQAVISSYSSSRGEEGGAGDCPAQGGAGGGGGIGTRDDRAIILSYNFEVRVMGRCCFSICVSGFHACFPLSYRDLYIGLLLYRVHI